jgi:hypothetical protein
VTALRRTNLPVGITVAHGGHAWILTGFTATADPAATTNFIVTSVRVVGPLWGLQSRTYGYDMRPDKKLTPLQLRGFFTPWHYAGVRMAWEDRWVSVQPIGRAAAPAAAPVAKATPSPRPTVRPTPSPTPSPAPTPRPSAKPSPTPEPSAPSSAPPVLASVGPAIAALVPASVGPGSADPFSRSPDPGLFGVDAPIGVLVGLVVAALAGLVAMGFANRGARRNGRGRARSLAAPAPGDR